MSSQSIDYEAIAKSSVPYGAEMQMTDKDVEGMIAGFFLDEGFAKADALIFHGGPSTPEEERRAELYENTARLLDSRFDGPDLVIPRDKQELFDDQLLDESNCELIEPSITEEDIAHTSGYSKTIHVTSDYHQQRVDDLLEIYDDRDYLVLGAETSNEDIQNWRKFGIKYGGKAASEFKEGLANLFLEPRFD